METKLAHITQVGGETVSQDLKEHLIHVAILCREYMRKMGCPAMGYIVGILHDAGKAGAAFQNRMDAIRAGRPDPGQGGGHASAGAVILNKAGGKPDTIYKGLHYRLCVRLFFPIMRLCRTISLWRERMDIKPGCSARRMNCRR